MLRQLTAVEVSRVDVAALRNAITIAEAAGVSARVVREARAALQAAQQRQQAAAALQRALSRPPGPSSTVAELTALQVCP